jgi:hypothetical protein
MVAPLPTLFEAFLFEHFFAITIKQFDAFMHAINQMGNDVLSQCPFPLLLFLESFLQNFVHNA